MVVYKKRVLRNNQICEMILDNLKENGNIAKKEDLVKKLISFASLSTIFVLYEFHGICKSCLLSKSSNPLNLKKEEINNENSSYANR
ncbi:hypothetical protein [Caldicellulosiruptor sp. F32]|uniref:hypothetical protein n=1 Tax=Caldicellulosiruptor sp. F32 TaxID=1214564 RepID=UPI0003A77F4B|nr:hypothetical protein [Caldicellulosiruptor sp. F32]